MPVTFKEFRETVAPYAGRAGKCATTPEVAVFSRQVMEYLLYSGSSAGKRKLCIQVRKGCVSLPPEVETPLKVRIDNRSAEIWNQWFSFHSDGESWDNCYPAGDILIEDGARSPLAYEIPEGGSVLGVLATCDEGDDSYVTIQGEDLTGREIYTIYNGEKIVGEKFKLTKDQVRYGKVIFGKVTAVVKSKTNGYVVLHSVDTVKQEIGMFLADWNPSEEKPLYKKYKVFSKNCGPVANLSILCRVRLKDSYLDNELTLFDNHLAILLASQRLQAEKNNDSEVASYKRQAVEDILEKEAGYKKPAGSMIDVFYPLSAGTIKGLF